MTLKIEYFKVTRNMGVTTKRVAVVEQDSTDGRFALALSRNGRARKGVREFDTLAEAEAEVNRFFA